MYMSTVENVRQKPDRSFRANCNSHRKWFPLRRNGDDTNRAVHGPHRHTCVMYINISRSIDRSSTVTLTNSTTPVYQLGSELCYRLSRRVSDRIRAKICWKQLFNVSLIGHPRVGLAFGSRVDKNCLGECAEKYDVSAGARTGMQKKRMQTVEKKVRDEVDPEKRGRKRVADATA